MPKPAEHQLYVKTGVVFSSLVGAVHFSNCSELYVPLEPGFFFSYVICAIYVVKLSESYVLP